MSRHDWGDLFGLVFLLALFMILTRASSNAPVVVRALGEAFTKIISFATDSSTASATTWNQLANQGSQG